MKIALVCSLVVGAVFAAGSVMAQTITDKVIINGTITYQTATTTNANGKVRNWHTKTVAFNNKSIIAMLNASSAFTNANAANAGGEKIPAGSFLAYDGNVIVTNKNGYKADLTVLQDATPASFATVAFPGSFVFFGHENIDPTLGGGSQTDLDANVVVTIRDGNGTSMVIAGPATETFSWDKLVTGQRMEHQSFKGSGGGSASYQGNANAVSRGQVSGSGHGKLSPAS